MSTFRLTLWQPTPIPATLCRPCPMKRRSSLPTGASGAATGCLYGYGATGEDGGHWVDEGYWEYEYTGYSASISGEMSLMPDDIVPTASGKTMKSGYGVKTEVRATLSTDAPTSHITYPQTAFSVFLSSSIRPICGFCSVPAAKVQNSSSSPTSFPPMTGQCISHRCGSPMPPTTPSIHRCGMHGLLTACYPST